MQDADKDDAIIVAITRDGDDLPGNTAITKDDITGQIKDRISNRLDKTVYVKSDARAKYGDVVAVVDEIRSAGVDQLGLADRAESGAKQRRLRLRTASSQREIEPRSCFRIVEAEVCTIRLLSIQKSRPRRFPPGAA